MKDLHRNTKMHKRKIKKKCNQEYSERDDVKDQSSVLFIIQFLRKRKEIRREQVR